VEKKGKREEGIEYLVFEIQIDKLYSCSVEQYKTEQ
jgi:hypothetical protein